MFYNPAAQNPNARNPDPRSTKGSARLPAQRTRHHIRLAKLGLGVYAASQLLFLAFLFFNHASFPLNLEATELTLLAHVQRVMARVPLYGEPSADFVPMVYTPLYYVLCLPLSWLLGPGLLAMRLTAIAATLGTLGTLVSAVRYRTGSWWWAGMTVGLFAASYRAMDTYVDNAHSDPWLLFLVVLGTAILDRKEWGLRGGLAATFCFVAAFWVKQPGAVFCMGGLLYLSWRLGWRSLTCWGLALGLGLVLYGAMPAAWLGPYFHYYTWDIPRSWTSVSLYAPYRLVGYSLRYFGVLTITALGVAGEALLRSQQRNNAWYFLLPVAILSGVLGALDEGSINNVFIPMATWFIVVGVLGLRQWSHGFGLCRRWRIRAVGLALSFGLLIYNPFSVIIPAEAAAAYQDLIATVEALPGQVYAPWIGALPEDSQNTLLWPAAHWVPLQDLVRGSGEPTERHPRLRGLISVVETPGRPAYVIQLSNAPDLAQDGVLAFAAPKYELVADWGDRFRALATLPKRFPSAWPRYLYRHRNPSNQPIAIRPIAIRVSLED